MLKFFTTSFFVFCIAFQSSAQHLEWRDTPEPTSVVERQITPAKYRTVQIDFQALRDYLNQAPNVQETSLRLSQFGISLPTPDGNNWHFKLVESPIMAPGLQDKFPEIKTFVGQGTGEYAHATLRLDYTHRGFHAQILISGQSYYIDPYSRESLDTYIVYARKDFYASTDKVMPECQVETVEFDPAPADENRPVKLEGKDTGYQPIPLALASNGTNLRTYDLALACTGEYASYHGGTVPLVMSAFVTSMNRVNGVFERDLSLTMQLVDDNDDLIFLNAATDPYTNNSGGTMLNQNQTTCDNVIGSSNYDIGHVFSTGGGGIAQLNAPCGSGKARGVTGQSTPEGDPFDIDYVAHEMGHQWGGNHTQNNPCNRSSGAAYEPGSASTIMGYAGICSPNLQSNSDDHFHNHSYNEMYSFSVVGSGNSCATITPTGNTPPTVSVRPGGFYIPVNTPFELTCDASDVNGDALTYCWEQYNLGPATAGGDNDLTNPSGNAPIFRSWSPTTDNTRVFPRLINLLFNTTVIGEHLPTYTRDLTFRCTVRDNAATGGGVTDAQVSFDATVSAGPFVVNYPNTGVSWTGNGAQTVTWDVANTNNAPVNCSEVDIFLSTDGGWTYPITLVSNVPNTGSASIIVPNISTSLARIKVKASDNIFFDISNQNFSISPGVINENDAALVAIMSPEEEFCGEEITPEITVLNVGTENLTSLDVFYDIPGISNGLTSWTGNIASGASENITLSTISTPPGEYTLSLLLLSPNGVSDEDPSNNSGSLTFNVNQTSGEDLPVTNNFENGFPGTGWTVDNPDGNTTWIEENITDDVNCNPSTVARINFYSYNASGETDDIVSPWISLQDANQPQVSFDYAYARYNSTYFDRMQVQVISGCETSWTTIWDESNLNLATAGSQTGLFTPDCGDWETVILNLDAYVGNSIQIRFRGLTGWGNDLYLDNISVTDEGPLDCGPGTYEFNGSCLTCPPGTYCPGDGNSYPCAAGSFSDLSGQIACTECPPGAYSNQIGATECLLCPAGTYQGISGASECIDCAEGTISDEGATSCTSCPPGYFVDNNECTECPPGTFCPGDGNSYPCAAGSFSDLPGQISCNECPPGAYSDQIGATECLLCPAGTYQGISGATECIDCAEGTISDEGATSCTSCPPGYFVDNNECTECPPGTFCPGDGNSYPCAAGSFSDLPGQISCNECPPGAYSDQIGATGCLLCPAGTYQGISGATECIDCAEGTISYEGATSCTSCPPGYFVDNNECTECPPGTFCPGDGNSYPCAAGSFSDLPGQISCNECPPGAYSEQIGATECLLCPAGTYQATTGATECSDCEEGSGSEEGAIECEPIDCNGEIGGNAYEDECGVCDDNPANDNQTCLDCAGVPNGSAYTDECGVCDDNPANDNQTCLDCAGVPNGSAYADECGVCDDNPANDNQTCLDCAGVPNGSAYTDECGVCDDNPANDNQTCVDCAGVPNGFAFIDDCDTCVGGTTGLDPCVQGCTSPTACNYNSSATIDDGSCIEPEANCTMCNEDNTGLVLIDADGDDICDADETTLSGSFEESPKCADRNLTIYVYEVGTANLVQTTSTITEGGVFETQLDVTPGNYDLYFKIDGYLSVATLDYAVSPISNPLLIEGLHVGDINNDDGINVIDVSLISGAFNSLEGDANYNPDADLDCNGGINVIDISLLSPGFNLIGEHASLQNE